MFSFELMFFEGYLFCYINPGRKQNSVKFEYKKRNKRKLTEHATG